MRMSEATARMNLRDYVRDDDIDFAIKVSPPPSVSSLMSLAPSFTGHATGDVGVVLASSEDLYPPHSPEIV
jgi:hypothetical protein